MNVFITGVTSGIGRQLALDYLNLGHRVFGIGRNNQALAELAVQGIITYQLDVSDLSAVRQFASRLQVEMPACDLAILNAGTCEYIELPSFNAEVFSRVMTVNFQGQVNCIELILPLLRQSSQPHLVGVASLAGYLPLSRAEAYGASKAAINYLLETLAIDLMPEGIAVTVVNPGFVATPLTAKNDFSMPFLLELSQAAAVIRHGIAKRRSVIAFPRRLAWPLLLFSWLPRRVWRQLAQHFRKG